MEIQRINAKCNYNMPLVVNNSVRNTSYISKNDLKDSFEPSFGVKPLTIPNGMFKTQKQAEAFSIIVEEVRTGKISKKTAQKLVGKNCDENLFAQVIDFIHANDPKVKTYSENELNKWFSHKFNTAKKALDGKKASEFAEQYENLAYFERTDNFDYNNLLYY